jgi:SAM-dependent methyltransferase
MTSRSASALHSSFSDYQAGRRGHWDLVARQLDSWTGWGSSYHRRLIQVYQFLVAPGQRVLEIGCGRGDLLAALRPGYGVGVDFSPEMIRRAARRHPNLTFFQADAHNLPLTGEFDVILLSDLVNDLWDVQCVFEEVARLSGPQTRILLNAYSRLWELPLEVTRKLRLSKPALDENWLTVDDVGNLLRLAGLETIRSWSEVLFPLPVPGLAPFFNRFLVRFWPFNELALTNLVVARRCPRPGEGRPAPRVSVVVPARNEAGNIPQILAGVPEMGGGTELIFVEGHSRDETYEAIERGMRDHPQRHCKLLRQTGVGKGDAVRLGFANASGDILMILDADLTVAPETLPRFYAALVERRGEFINGVRLVYPMEQQAMRFLNLIGNKLFSLAFSWLLGQPIKDTLCGTKVLWRSDYERIAANRAYFGDFDPFGDFDLLFGAAKQNLKIVDLPIRYRERTYGTTNIQRWKHGWLLLRMTIVAFLRLKLA